MGDEKFYEISEALSGQTVYFPFDYEWNDKEMRNMKLREDYYSGMYEVTDLANKYKLSISRVYKIIQQVGR
ncbi:MAG: Mor transcription activator family protein [Eubacterium sp.]|nr:Mor transcription activator family protein [Eubacterium sp.]